MKRVNVINPLDNFKKVRVAAYARVSTESDEQVRSLVAQKEYYQRYIESNAKWQFIGVYYDEGFSGTSLKKRVGLNRLIDDCEKGLVDLIITKSISRFSRNTVDCINLVRRLLTYGVPIIFEKENIRTDDMDGELMLSILAELAASESKHISENEKWGVRKRFKDGTFVISYLPYGYTNINGVMTIVPEEAEIVKEIFSLILEGESTACIANILNSRNIKTKRNGRWSTSTIRGIIKNEKYTGDTLFQKTYTDDNFNRHKNNGEKERYFIENHHIAIISHDLFQKANKILQQRGLEKGNCENTDKYNRRYSFSGRIICGECEGVFKRRTHSLPNRKYIAWCCRTHIENKQQCSMKYVKQEDLQYAFVMMTNKLIYSKEFILKPLKVQLDRLESKGVETQITKIRNKILDIQVKMEETEKLHHQGYLSATVYQNLKSKLNQEYDYFKKQETQMISLEYKNENLKKEIDNFIKKLKKRDYLKVYDDELFMEIVEKVIVVSREKVKFVLKCGLALEEMMI